MNAFDKLVEEHTIASDDEFVRRSNGIERALVALYASTPIAEADRSVMRSETVHLVSVGTVLQIVVRCVNRLMNERGE